MMGDRDRSPRRGDRGGGGGERKSRKGPPEKRIFVSNLPYDMKWQEVKDLFRKEVGEVSYVELFNDESGKPRGAGVMEFPTVEMAKTAIDKMHRHDYKGRKIVVKEDFDAQRDPHGRILGRRDGGEGRQMDNRGGRGEGMMGTGMGGGDNMGPGGGGCGNTYGLSPQFLDSLSISGPLHTRLFVANMDYSVDEKKLKEVFRLAGRVVGIELSRDKENKSRGFACVVFDHPVEAVQAISMFHGQQLFDRKLSVRFDKVAEEEPPRNLNRLPDGLHSVGMGLGQDGMPLLNVRDNLPSAAEMGNIGNNMGGGGGSMGPGAAGLMGASSPASNAANVGQAALQAALATIMAGMTGGNAGGQGGNMGDSGNMGGGSGGLGGMMGNIGGGGGGSNGGMGVGMDRGMGGGMDRGMGGGMDRGMSMDRIDRNMNGSMDRSMDRGNMGDSLGGMGGSQGGGNSFNSPPSGTWSSQVNNMGSVGGGSGGRSDRVMIRNLPGDCNWSTLKDRFSHSGDIKFAEIKERGLGLIRFGSERDAERAVSMMNGQRIDGRQIAVSLY